MPKTKNMTGYIKADLLPEEEKAAIVEFSKEEIRPSKAGNDINHLIFLGTIPNQNFVEWDIPDFCISNLNELVKEIGEDWNGKTFKLFQKKGIVVLKVDTEKVS